MLRRNPFFTNRATCCKRLFTSSSSFLSTFTTAAAVALPKQQSFVRFCSSSSSDQKTVNTTTNELIQKCQILDEKCFSWTLNQQDMEDVIQTLYDISSGKITTPAENTDAGNPVIPYPDLENPEKRGVEVPYVMSTLLRCVFSYPSWKTMSLAPNSEHSLQKTPTERMGLRRQNCPERDYLAMPIQVCNLPSEQDEARRVFVLGTSESEFEQFKPEMEKKFGGLHTESVTGYELFQLAQMTMYGIQRQQQENPQSDGKPVPTFHGISLNPNKERFVLLGSDPAGLIIARNISCDAALENALVLVRWLVQESPRTVLTGHQGGFVSSCVASVLERATYYALQDKDGAAFLFTSMHHLLRYKSFAQKSAPEDWDARAPWTVGTTDAANIDWVMGGQRSPMINPIAPGDTVAMEKKFPASNVVFSVDGIQQMSGIIEHMKKTMSMTGGNQSQEQSNNKPEGDGNGDKK